MAKAISFITLKEHRKGLCRFVEEGGVFRA